MTRQHAPFQGYTLHQLAKAYIKPEHLTRGLERLRKDSGIEPAVVGYLFQHGFIDGEEATFLLKTKHPQRPKLDGHDATERYCLVHRILKHLTRWEQGEEPAHPVPGLKRNVVTSRALCSKKIQARERLRAELRAKRRM
jgi:hypothetical protein